MIVFFADACISLLNDSAYLSFGASPLGLIDGLSMLATLATSIALFVLLAVSKVVPMRRTWPLVVYKPAALLLLILLSIYYFRHLGAISLALSLGQLILAAFLFRITTGRIRPRWPAIRAEDLPESGFSLSRFVGFALLTGLVLIPGVIVYFGVCASLAVGHFSNHFLIFSLQGLSVRAKTYERSDGKTVELVPMIHVGEAQFYAQVAESFPTNAIVLLEGVTDEQHLLRQKLNYKRLASSLGLAEQQATFARHTPSAPR